jgi:hypothetical protein
MSNDHFHPIAGLHPGRMRLLFLAMLAFGGSIGNVYAGTSPTLPLAVPFDFENNQIYLRVGINSHVPAWFVLDSGASGCSIDAAVAKRLGLATHGEIRGTGAGKGTYEITFTDNVSYQLAGLRVTVRQSYVVDLSVQPTILGREIAGILGYDFFERYVVAVDYDAAVLTLSDPARYSYAGPGTVVPFTLVKKTPHITVHVTVSGEAARDREVLVDSGSEDPLDDDSLATAPQRLEIIGGVGLGQEFRTTVGRAQQLGIGPYVLEEPFGATGGVPLIGTEILRRFYVVFDYSHTRLILEPNQHFHDAFSFDASGLDLRWAPDAFLIHDVAKPSPAAEVGLQAGDAIIAIDGQAATDFRLDQIVRLLTHAGNLVKLTVRRGSNQFETSLPLRHRL